MEYLLTLLYTLIFLFIFWKVPFYRAEGLGKKTIAVVFLLKILAGLGMGLVYSYYYTGRNTADVFKYFDDSKVMFNALFSKPLDYFCMMTGIGNDSDYFNVHYYKLMNNWYRVYESNLYNESHTMIRFNAFVRIFSFGYFNVHTVFVCFFSLTGLIALYKTVVNFIVGKNRVLIFGIFLLPSVVFWGSGVLKEALLFFGLGMLIWHLFVIQIKFNVTSLLWIIASVMLLYYTKLYVLAIVIPILLGLLWIRLTNEKYILLKFLLVFAVYIIAVINLKHIFPAVDAMDILVTKQRDFIGLARSMNSGSLIEIPLLAPDLLTFLKQSPRAFFFTLFRPFVFERGSIMILMAAVENIIIIIILLAAIVFCNFRQVKKSLFYACLFGVVFMFVLTGLITPVMGAMVRYKVPALPFLMIACIMLLDMGKIKKRLPFIFRKLSKIL